MKTIGRILALIAASLLALSFSSATGVLAATPATSKLIGASSTSISVSITAKSAVRVYLEYGYSKLRYTSRTSVRSIPRGATQVVIIGGLRASSAIYYRLRYAMAGKAIFQVSAQGTARTSGTSAEYVFAVEADPHMDDNSTAAIFSATLNQIVKAKPAFLMDLGDIFMTDKLQNKSSASIRERYALMKDFYDKLDGIPYYFTLGNHDGELGYSTFNTKGYRKEYFPDQTGELAYYSFTSPDALHIVLDAFTYTTQNPKDDGWQWTLGDAQYRWLKATLESSTAAHKFVYIHHLLYGNAAARGGAEKAQLNEWGGRNTDGSEGFTEHRPNWQQPIHSLLVENGVDFVFKGHDHIYVKQELDGIVYQTLPQPSHAGDKTDSAAQYGYQGGKVVGGSGFLKITTTASTVKVEFIGYDGAVKDSYAKSN